MHFCQDEARQLILLVPFLGTLWAWLRARWHHRRKHPECEGKKE